VSKLVLDGAISVSDWLNRDFVWYFGVLKRAWQPKAAEAASAITKFLSWRIQIQVLEFAYKDYTIVLKDSDRDVPFHQRSCSVLKIG
jgi:hypothetical protein